MTKQFKSTTNNKKNIDRMTSKTVLVAGCGVAGLSTCMELKARGYHVIAFDAHKVPSSWAASNDLNKVVRMIYSDEDYCKMAIEAVDQWKHNPVFKGCFIESGCVIANSEGSIKNGYNDEEVNKCKKNFEKFHRNLKICQLQDSDDLARRLPILKDNELTGRQLEISSDTGYGKAAASLIRTYNFCRYVLGVEFHDGEGGKIVKYGNHFVETVTGKKYYGDCVLIACGAASGYLVDFHDQVRCLGEFVTHIQLTDEEYEKYKNMPIIDIGNLGFYFPPDDKLHRIKFVVQSMRGTNTVTNPVTGKGTVSLPKYLNNSKIKGIPNEAKREVRKLIKQTMPKFLKRPFVNSLVCWCANTCNMDWIIDRVPGYSSVFVFGGDSGHAYKFLPVIGIYVADKIEGKLDPKLEKKWMWEKAPKWPKYWPAGAASEKYELDSMDWSISHL